MKLPFKKQSNNNQNKEVKRAKSLLHSLFKLKFVKLAIITILTIVLLPFIIFLFIKPKPVDKITYGITFSNKYAKDLGLDWKDAYIKMFDELNVKNIRLVAYWDEIEKEDDVFDFSDIKYQLDEAEKRNVNVILITGYKTVRYPECFAPEWWKELSTAEEKNKELYEYIRETMTQLKSYKSIKIWQVENEPFFAFGVCENISQEVVKREIEIVRGFDDRSIMVQDSGEGGLWKKTYEMGDYLGISMYRKIWYDFWGLFFGNFIYFKYPLAHWTYKIKADLVGVPYKKIIVTELQAEPWGPGINSVLSKEEKDKSFSRNDFIDTINYAQKAGFDQLYLWGAEWWLFEAEKNGESFYWNTAKALFTE